MTTELTKTVAGMQDALVMDLKGIVAEADQLLNEVACATAEDFAAARTQIAEKLGDAKGRLTAARDAITGKARYVADSTCQYVAANPWQVIGAAAAVGLVVGILSSRR